MHNDPEKKKFFLDTLNPDDKNKIITADLEKSYEESNKEKKKQLQQKVKELYKKDRGLLTHRERIHFNLPLEQRLKGGIDNLTSWIKLMELIFENSGSKEQTKITKWTERTKNRTI